MAIPVHPYPGTTRMVVVYDVESANSTVQTAARIPVKLQRMPHVFARVLQLPFHSETDVVVYETPECYMFEIQHSGLNEEDMQVRITEIVPGAVKVVIGAVEPMSLETQVNCWRFRLPPTTSPEGTRVEYQGEVMVVTVPKLDLSPTDRE